MLNINTFFIRNFWSDLYWYKRPSFVMTL